MIKIKYSQKKVKFIPPKSVKKKKKERIEVKTIAEIPAKPKELKIIHCLFGDLKLKDGRTNKAHYGAAKALRSYGAKNHIHMVMEEDNKRFLMEKGLDEKNIIYDKSSPKIKPGVSVTWFYKTYLLYVASQVFSEYSILYLDYDCKLRRKIDKKDLLDRLEANKKSIQCPPVRYRRRIFTNFNSRPQNWGVQCCLVYWEDPSIVKKWFDNYISMDTRNDEQVLFITLEQLFGPLSVDSIYDFDTTIIQTVRRPKESKRYNANNYKDAYFSHR